MGRFWMNDEVTRSRKYKAYEISTLAALTSRAASREGWSISMKDLAAEAGTSPKSVQRAVRRLQADGLIRVTERGENGSQLPNLYHVLTPRSEGPAPRSGRPVPPVRVTDVRKSQRTYESVTTSIRGDGHEPSAPAVWSGNPSDPDPAAFARPRRQVIEEFNAFATPWKAEPDYDEGEVF